MDDFTAGLTGCGTAPTLPALQASPKVIPTVTTSPSIQAPTPIVTPTPTVTPSPTPSASPTPTTETFDVYQDAASLCQALSTWTPSLTTINIQYAQSEAVGAPYFLTLSAGVITATSGTVAQPTSAASEACANNNCMTVSNSDCSFEISHGQMVDAAF